MLQGLASSNILVGFWFNFSLSGPLPPLSLVRGPAPVGARVLAFTISPEIQAHCPISLLSTSHPHGPKTPKLGLFLNCQVPAMQSHFPPDNSESFTHSTHSLCTPHAGRPQSPGRPGVLLPGNSCLLICLQGSSPSHLLSRLLPLGVGSDAIFSGPSPWHFEPWSGLWLFPLWFLSLVPTYPWHMLDLTGASCLVSVSPLRWQGPMGRKPCLHPVCSPWTWSGAHTECLSKCFFKQMYQRKELSIQPYRSRPKPSHCLLSLENLLRTFVSANTSPSYPRYKWETTHSNHSVPALVFKKT